MGATRQAALGRPRSASADLSCCRVRACASRCARLSVRICRVQAHSAPPAPAHKQASEGREQRTSGGSPCQTLQLARTGGAVGGPRDHGHVQKALSPQKAHCSERGSAQQQPEQVGPRRRRHGAVFAVRPPARVRTPCAAPMHVRRQCARTCATYEARVCVSGLQTHTWSCDARIHINMRVPGFVGHSVGARTCLCLRARGGPPRRWNAVVLLCVCVVVVVVVVVCVCVCVCMCAPISRSLSPNPKTLNPTP